jgi:hypothetical protein
MGMRQVSEGRPGMCVRRLSMERFAHMRSVPAENPLSWIFYDLDCAALKGVLAKIVKILSPPQGGR